MVSACLEAHRIDGNPKWVAHAQRAFNWFLGENHLQQSLYDPSTGGCRDGLHADRANENQGAEATLSFLGIGMPGSVMSWGNDISAAQASIRTNPAVLLYPATALSITVLSFIMLGDALRDALDPKSRQR